MPERPTQLSPRDPYGPKSPHVRSIILDLVFTLLTCGLWNLRVQYAQMQALNEILKENKYRFGKWLLFCVITCGLYHFYHEYLKSVDIARVIKKTHEEPVIEIVLMVMGLAFVADAIQQSSINAYYGDHQV